MLAFTVSAKSEDDSHLRWVILSDVPGLHFLYICGKILLATQRLYTMSSDVCRMVLLLAITMLGVLWFGIIVTFTGTDSSDANFKFVNSIRLGTGCGLLIIISCFAINVRQHLHKVKDVDVVVLFGVSVRTLGQVTMIVFVTQLLKSICLIVMIALPMTTNVMVIQKSSSMLDLIFVTAYYTCGELLCASLLSYRLRCDLKGERLQLLLERSWLPQGLEIDSKELKEMKFLASGGYGKVYRAEWRGRMVAVKQLFLNFPESTSHDLPVSDDSTTPSSSNGGSPKKRVVMNARLRTQIMEEQTRRFLLEAELLAHLRHKNILRLIGYTHFKREQTIAIVTEYISGGSLYDLLHRPHRYGYSRGPSWRPLSARQEFSVSIGIAHGMEFLHSRNVCHRDLKSANVLLTKDCVPQICDFGLAKWMEFSNRTTSAHGTVLWTAPELLLGRECT